MKNCFTSLRVQYLLIETHLVSHMTSKKLPQKTFARTFKNITKHSKHNILTFQIKEAANQTSLIHWHFKAARLPCARVCVRELQRLSFLCRQGTRQFKRISWCLNKTGQNITNREMEKRTCREGGKGYFRGACDCVCVCVWGGSISIKASKRKSWAVEADWPY